MAGTIRVQARIPYVRTTVSMESGLDGRNNAALPAITWRRYGRSQWSPA